MFCWMKRTEGREGREEEERAGEGRKGSTELFFACRWKSSALQTNIFWIKLPFKYWWSTDLKISFFAFLTRRNKRAMLVAFNYNLKAMSKRLSEVGAIIGSWNKKRRNVYHVKHVKRHDKKIWNPNGTRTHDLLWAIYILSYEELQHFWIQGDIVDYGNFERVAKWKKTIRDNISFIMTYKGLTPPPPPRFYCLTLNLLKC